MGDTSPTTGEDFYSLSWERIRDVLSVLNIGEGKLAQVTQPLVNRYQEMVDRDIDALLEDTYNTPLRAMNQVQPDGSTKRVFPGDVRRCAIYWTAGYLLLNEFQQLAENITEQATNYVTDAQKQIFAMKRFTHRIPGQKRKSHYSHTIPPNFQPPAIPEPDW